jgi:hypothetical protein
MRSIIRASATLFIVLGAGVAAFSSLVSTTAVLRGAASPYASYPEVIGLIVALAGMVSGASIVLVGGTAYLLSSIDARIEDAARSAAAGRIGADGTGAA